ncbi:MAG: hypothetical protein AAB902_02630 [Patescibacteria group bacterium]
MQIIKKVYNWFNKNMPLPPPTKTIEEILTDLNAEGKGTWIPLDGYYGISSPELTDSKIVNFLSAKRGIVFKSFLNLQTAEVRSYVAKFLDIPDKDREKLI